jgi:hypothetical protein
MILLLKMNVKHIDSKAGVTLPILTPSKEVRFFIFFPDETNERRCLSAKKHDFQETEE